jgi:hypothetical protein
MCSAHLLLVSLMILMMSGREEEIFFMQFFPFFTPSYTLFWDSEARSV